MGHYNSGKPMIFQITENKVHWSESPTENKGIRYFKDNLMKIIDNLKRQKHSRRRDTQRKA